MKFENPNFLDETNFQDLVQVLISLKRIILNGCISLGKPSPCFCDHTTSLSTVAYNLLQEQVLPTHPIPSFEWRSPTCSKNLIPIQNNPSLLPLHSTQTQLFRSLNSSYKRRKQPAPHCFVTNLTENGTGPTKGDDTNYKLESSIFSSFIISFEQ